ncbi:hypothetical protein EJ03DRAFT_7517 [Teratosphaeria nubilosa]|uniref:Uncharacterized protein n=1 Tax=Teratosphaeria nubilosa TaxID=161662 RepID=A0A6G1LPQ3_9PEZI|nr:hypothetical protein EJ03DRAFT_7517 [Teratosphaeria nubilosa]
MSSRHILQLALSSFLNPCGIIDWCLIKSSHSLRPNSRTSLLSVLYYTSSNALEILQVGSVVAGLVLVVPLARSYWTSCAFAHSY